LVSAKPVAATLENERVGHRSGVSPFDGLVVSQNHWKVRCCTSSKNASFDATGTPVTTVAFEHADATARKIAAAVARKRRRESCQPVGVSGGTKSRSATEPRERHTARSRHYG
jgi:hypothetical protein